MASALLHSKVEYGNSLPVGFILFQTMQTQTAPLAYVPASAGWTVWAILCFHWDIWMKVKSGLTDITDEIKSKLDQLFQFVFWSVEKAWKHFHVEHFQSTLNSSSATVLHAVGLASTLKKLLKYDILHGKVRREWWYIVANTVFT